MKQPIYSDHLESKIAKALEDAGVNFKHESQGGNQRLDFYLPEYGIYIEVKQYSTDRSAIQLALHDNVILVQGVISVEFIAKLLTGVQKIPTGNGRDY